MKILGKFVYLKSLSLDDSFFIFKLRQNKLISYYLHKPPKTLNDQKRWIKKNMKNSTTRDFIIIDKKNNQKIGTIGFNNLNSNTAEWGRWISKGHAIQNIEAIILLLNYGFNKLKLKKIYSLTNINNKKVINFHKNTPASYNGIIKSIFLINNKKIDAAKYSFNKMKFLDFKKNFDFMTLSTRL